MCVFDSPPTLCDQACGHIKFNSNLDEMIDVMEHMPPLPCSDPSEVSIGELLNNNEQLSKTIQQQNMVIEETLNKIQEAIKSHK